MRRRNALAALFLLLILPGFQTPSWALPDELKPVEKVALQPLVAQVRRVKEALNYIGRPLSAAESSSLDAAFEKGGEAAVAGIQGVLAPHVLFAVHINPESRVKVARGPAAAPAHANPASQAPGGARGRGAPPDRQRNGRYPRGGARAW